MAKQYVRTVGEHSLTSDAVVRLRFASPGFFVVTHQDLDTFGRYEQRGERDVRVYLRPGVVGVYLTDGETVGYTLNLKEGG